MASLQELIAQKEALEHQIEQTKNKDRGEAIEKIRSLMSDYGLSAADIAVNRSPKPRAGKGNKVAAKYRDGSTGNTWSGRGLQPRWLKAALESGKKLADFSV